VNLHGSIDFYLYRLDNLINPNPNRPNLTYEFLGITRVWRWTKDRMQAAYDAGLVVQTRRGAVPQLKRYLDEQRGIPLATFGQTSLQFGTGNSSPEIGKPMLSPLKS